MFGCERVAGKKVSGLEISTPHGENITVTDIFESESCDPERHPNTCRLCFALFAVKLEWPASSGRVRSARRWLAWPFGKSHRGTLIGSGHEIQHDNGLFQVFNFLKCRFETRFQPSSAILRKKAGSINIMHFMGLLGRLRLARGCLWMKLLAPRSSSIMNILLGVLATDFVERMSPQHRKQRRLGANQIFLFPFSGCFWHKIFKCHCQRC